MAKKPPIIIPTKGIPNQVPTTVPRIPQIKYKEKSKKKDPVPAKMLVSFFMGRVDLAGGEGGGAILEP